MQAFSYTKPLSAMSEIEFLQHLSPLRTKFPARFLLYTISSMPRFGTFHNKSLDHIRCRLGSFGKTSIHYSSKHAQKKLTRHHSSPAELRHTLHISTAIAPSPSCLLEKEAYHMTVIKEDIRKLQSTFLILHPLPLPPPPFTSHLPLSHQTGSPPLLSQCYM